jgi:hypothetical protein
MVRPSLVFLIRRLFAPKPMRHGRITLIESDQRNFLIGPLVSEVMRYPYFNWIDNSDERKPAPDQCVISRGAQYTLSRKYDGLTVDTRKFDSQEKSECLKLVMQQLASLRRSSRRR